MKKCNELVISKNLIFLILSGLFNDATTCCDYMIPAIEE